jgi:contractile injection system tube protein
MGSDTVGFFDFLFPKTLGQAEIRVIPPANVRTLRVSFILKTFKLSKENDFAEISVPGLNGEPLQFVRGHSRTLSTVLSFDGRATNTDVRQSMQHVMDLMKVDGATHAPPVLLFEWTGFSLRCVLESSFMQSFSALFSDGRPSRGRMHVVFRECLTLQELLQEAERQ